MPAHVKYPRLPGETQETWRRRRQKLARQAFATRNPTYREDYAQRICTLLDPVLARHRVERDALRLRHEIEIAEFRRQIVRLTRQSKARTNPTQNP